MANYLPDIPFDTDTGTLVILGKLFLKLSELLDDSDVGKGLSHRITMAMEVARAEGPKYPMDVLENAQVDVNFIKFWVDDYVSRLRASNSNQRYVLLIERHIPILNNIINQDSFLSRSTAFKHLREQLNVLYDNLFFRLLGKSVEGMEYEQFKIPWTENRRWREWIATRGGRENTPVDAGISEILGKLSDMLSEPEQPLYIEGKGKVIEGKGKGVKEFQQPMDYIEKGSENLNIFHMESRESQGGKQMNIIWDGSTIRKQKSRATDKGGKQVNIIWDESAIGKQIIRPTNKAKRDKSTIRKQIIRATDKANKIINKDEKDIEPIKIWVDDYLKNIRHRSSSFQLYFDRINRDMGRLDDFIERLDDFMFLNPSLTDDSLLSIIIAGKMLKEREHYLHEIFFMDLKEKSRNPKFHDEFKSGARCLSIGLLRDLIRLQNSLQNSTREVVNCYQLIGSLTVTKEVIVVASDGIDVRKGYYHEGNCHENRRTVAVERLRKTHYSLVVKEKGYLIESVKHANITTCFGVESDEDSHYICLEPYMCSLYDFIVENGDGENGEGENKLELWRNGCASHLLKNLMRDIAVGLTHLHNLKIVHGDLKPHYIHVIKTSTRLTAKISHIGISTTPKPDVILENMRSLMGWHSREVMRGESQNANVDLFSLGCILFFCATQGKHPFGEDFERDANIVRDNKNLGLVEDFPEAFDLISHLLNSNPKMRPKTEEVIHHPLFWDSQMQKTFLFETNKRLHDQNSQLLKTLEGVSGCKDWNTKIDSAFLEESVQYIRRHGYRPYNFNSVRDLLFLIRSCLVHYGQFSVWSKTILGSNPEGVLKYFSTRFPKLFIDVYNVISEHDKNKKYFSGAMEVEALLEKRNTSGSGTENTVSCP